MRILLWGAERIGDLVMTFPALKLLRRIDPACRLTFATTDYAQEVLELSGLVEEIVPYSFKHDLLNLFAWRRLRKRVAGGEFDRVILLGKVTKFRRKISKAEEGVTESVPRAHYHAAEQHMETVKVALGRPDVDTSGLTPRIEVRDNAEDLQQLRDAGAPLSDPYIVLHAATNRVLRKRWSAGKRVAEKLWPPDRQHALLAALCEEWPGVRVMLVGAPAERAFIEEEVIGDAPREGVVNLAGETSIRQTLILLKHARLLICSDSGVMHLGTVVGCPLVALFGPTEEGYTGPFTDRADVWRVRERPETRDMAALRVETVLGAVRQALRAV